MPSEKYQLASKNLIVLAGTAVTVIPAVLTIIIPDDHVRDLAAQLRLQLLYVALAAALFLTLLRSWREHPRLYAAAVIATLSHVFVIASAYVNWPAAEPIGRRNSHLSLLNSNLYIGNRHFDLFTAAVERYRPDVICLQELTLGWLPTLSFIRTASLY